MYAVSRGLSGEIGPRTHGRLRKWLEDRHPMLTKSRVWYHSGKKQLILQHRGLEVSFATEDRAGTVLDRYIYTCPKKALWDTCGTRLELFWSRAQTYGKSAWPRSRTTCMDRGDRPPYALLPLQLLSRHYVRPEPTLRIYMHMLLPVRPQPFARMTSLLPPPPVATDTKTRALAEGLPHAAARWEGRAATQCYATSADARCGWRPGGGGGEEAHRPTQTALPPVSLITWPIAGRTPGQHQSRPA